MRWVIDLWKNRCPHCRKGAVFASFWGMNDTCPHCGIVYERESGFFSMSIFIGYVLALVLAAPVFLLAYWLGAETIWEYLVPASAVVLIATPWIFRYARLIWLYLDEWLDPRPASEKPRP